MLFQTRALDPATQALLSTKVEALDEADARAQLLARQLQPISLRPQRSWGGRRGGDSFSVLLFAQELHALVQAGLSLIESLEAFAEKERAPQARAVLQRLIGGLREGQRFSAALRAQSTVFPPLFVGIVEAAESTGELASALERYAAYALRLQALRQRVVSAAIYPSILLGVGALVALFLLGYVVPRFAAVYRSGNRTLPWGSQLLLEWGEFAGRHGVWLLVLLALGAAALAWWARSLARQGDWSRAAARLPGVARWLELLTLSRLFLTLGLLLRGGLPVQPALALVRSVLPPARAAAVDAVSQRVAEGWPLSAALEEARLSTPISLRFVRAGERSGQVADMLHRAALYHDAETARWIERFSRVFEPLLMALIGAVIGVIVLLLYMPIFDLAGSLQ
jgi:general secretion pathway protein F